MPIRRAVNRYAMDLSLVEEVISIDFRPSTPDDYGFATRELSILIFVRATESAGNSSTPAGIPFSRSIYDITSTYSCSDRPHGSFFGIRSRRKPNNCESFFPAHDVVNCGPTCVTAG